MALLPAAPAIAEDLRLLPPAIGTSEVVTADGRTGLALGGYDPVTYWLPGGVRLGRPDTAVVWRGLVWRFSGPANRAAFLRDPESLMPRLGGYDAAAAAEGGIVGSDPRLYAVQDGRLYLFRTEASRSRFLADEALARDSERRWPTLLRTLPHG